MIGIVCAFFHTEGKGFYSKFERHCDWWLYKERHLVEKYFLKLKAFRRIATRYDKLAATYLGFICIASILIWLK